MRVEREREKKRESDERIERKRGARVRERYKRDESN